MKNQEGAGYASANDALTVKRNTFWAVEVEGKIDVSDLYNTRATARHIRNTFYSDCKTAVRKVIISVQRGQ